MCPSKLSAVPAPRLQYASLFKCGEVSDLPPQVKCGGHASNPGFSSTTGVHISMSRFNEVTYDPSSKTAVIGGGLVWDEVYAALAPYHVSIAGGRKVGVGVAGFTLGGGYSWLTNQYGLAVDTVVAYELVKPTGDIVTITQESDPDLFFGLKGGLILFKSVDIPAVTAATAAYSTSVSDPKAAIITSYTALPGEPGISLHLFYDGPTPPAGIFDDFLVIPYYAKDVSTRDFLSLVKVFPADDTYGYRGIFHGLAVAQYTPKILGAIANETVFWSSRLKELGAVDIDYGVQPFLPTVFTHGTYGSSAYPPSRGKSLCPLNLYLAWSDKRFDVVFHEAARQSITHLREVALSEGQDVANAAIYPNYAIYDTPLENLYGDTVLALRALKASVDPDNVMGLTGGFKF
ncbi:hypothetical protein DXG01_017002 [Tephrocybe rancida]|nr:hypothetical protein DXG01_017002 [Tephrocybe rancida]